MKDTRRQEIRPAGAGSKRDGWYKWVWRGAASRRQLLATRGLGAGYAPVYGIGHSGGGATMCTSISSSLKDVIRSMSPWRAP